MPRASFKAWTICSRSLASEAGSLSAAEPRSASEASEREQIVQALKEARGIIAGPSGAAARLGIKRTTLNSRIRKLGITRDEIWAGSSL